MTQRPKICVALDEESLDDNLRLAEKIAADADIFKLNDDAVDDAGLAPLIKPFTEFGVELFVDMKLDKGQTRMVRRVVKAAELGASYVNAFARCDRRLQGPARALEDSKCQLLVVTVLTHESEDYCQKYYRRSLLETVRFLTEAAIEFGCSRPILPVPGLPAIADLDLVKWNPGIRPEWSERKANDQELTGTPREAVLGGSSVLIVGSPITHSDDPLSALRQIRKEVNGAWEEIERGS